MPARLFCPPLLLILATALAVPMDVLRGQQSDHDARGLAAVRCLAPPVVDGRTDDPAWQEAVWTDPFVDITGDAAHLPRFRTTAAVAWDTTALYVALRMEEPHVWASITRRDSGVLHDNAVEFLFDPDGDHHRYGEVAVNALNTVWDQLIERPFRDGGPARTAWDIAELVTAVDIQGTLNDPSDTDDGWSVEFRIPWQSIRELGPWKIPPSAGDLWRVNFARVQCRVQSDSGRYVKLTEQPDSWSWNPQGEVDLHRPERWGVLLFTDAREGMPRRVADPDGRYRRVLMDAYEAQKRFFRTHRRWAFSVEELNAMREVPLHAFVRVELTEQGFEMVLPLGPEPDAAQMRVTQDGRLFRSDRP